MIGDTKTVETMPIGVKEPICFNVIGAVNIWAPLLAPIEFEMITGNLATVKKLKKSPKNNIPARAP